LLICLTVISTQGAINEVFAQGAQGSSTPESFKVRLYEFSLCKDSSCQSKLALVSSAQEFDIATVSSGQSAGTFGGGIVSIEAGTYQYAYMIWGRNLGLRGRVPFSLSGNDRDCISVSGASLSEYGGSVGSILTQDTGTPGNATQYISAPDDQGSTGNITFLNDTQVSTLIPLSSPIILNTTNPADLPAMTVSFNVTDTLRVFIDQNSSSDPDDWDCEIGLEPPVITFQIGSQTTVINIDTGSE
jgi:hypothetical protein